MWRWPPFFSWLSSMALWITIMNMTQRKKAKMQVIVTTAILARSATIWCRFAKKTSVFLPSSFLFWLIHQWMSLNKKMQFLLIFIDQARRKMNEHFWVSHHEWDFWEMTSVLCFIKSLYELQRMKIKISFDTSSLQNCMVDLKKLMTPWELMIANQVQFRWILFTTTFLNHETIIKS